MIDATWAALEKSLDLRTRAHAIHISNIANANVPDFKAKKIDFEDRMRTALESLNSDAPLLTRENSAASQVSGIEADIYQDPMAKPSRDGNTVNVDREQTEIAKNMIGFEGSVQLLNKRIAMQKYILGEAGR